VLRTRYGSERRLAIEVEDNAGGIPAEILPRIFTPFFTTKGAKGSGLGLAMTKKFVEDMGAKIEVESQEGLGTKFIISIQDDPDELKVQPTPLPPSGHAARESSEE
jgi:signal transduction histidine kinase